MYPRVHHSEGKALVGNAHCSFQIPFCSCEDERIAAFEEILSKYESGEMSVSVPSSPATKWCHWSSALPMFSKACQEDPALTCLERVKFYICLLLAASLLLYGSKMRVRKWRWNQGADWDISSGTPVSLPL